MKQQPTLLICTAILFIVTACQAEAEKDTKADNPRDADTPQVHVSEYNPPVWPEPRPDQIEVMVLGVFHMSNPGQDEYNIDADDVRNAKRQDELEDLAARLALFQPDLIATEVSYKSQDRLDSLYQQVPMDSLLKKYANEAIQVGFRLGKRLGHERVYAIDYRQRLGNDSLSALYEKYDGDIPHKIPYPKLDWDSIMAASQKLLSESSIVDYLIHTNRENEHLKNHYGMFAYLRAGENDNFGGAENLAIWYGRNFKMVHNVYRAAKPETRRILLIVGSGHVSPIRHILSDAPMFCPVSPMPYLLGDGK